jgi:hypothetical protein
MENLKKSNFLYKRISREIKIFRDRGQFLLY